METAIFAAAIFMLLMGRPRLHYGLPTDGSYMSHDRTMMINGFFMVLMVLRHISIFCCPVQPEDEWYYIHVDAPMIQFIVCTYFFYSGYGIMYSLQTKGRLYLRQLLTKRFTGLYIRFGFAAAIACTFTALVTEDFPAQAQKFAYTMIGCGDWWFIVMSLVLYLLTWISFSLVSFSPDNLRRSAAAIGILTILIGIVITLMFPYKTFCWLSTEWCFPAGMLYCIHRRKLEYIVRESRIPCFLWGSALIYASQSGRLGTSPCLPRLSAGSPAYRSAGWALFTTPRLWPASLPWESPGSLPPSRGSAPPRLWSGWAETPFTSSCSNMYP